MNIYFGPINLNVWDMFNKINEIGQVETFLATKDMNVGDILLLYVGGQKNDVESGVYAIARITSNVFVLRENPDDYCNNKRTIKAEILKISYNNPLADENLCKQMFNQFRSVHRMKDLDQIELASVLIRSA